VFGRGGSEVRLGVEMSRALQTRPKGKKKVPAPCDSGQIDGSKDNDTFFFAPDFSAETVIC